ncbi:9229_t:CDS:2 [Paraglomus brasilianum]|uniref:9229_t:CDS:1 n=1 Tax=Paraglomus brasilianum TaxID=144538 RepID=A0A9N8Z0Z8_9GLOM|nr:9229_t:CDS:2 [Paraglomus brasilianum]
MNQLSSPTEAASFFRSKIEESFQKTSATLNQWKTYLTDYENLQKTLKTLDEETEYKAMVPIGKMAFMPGKIVHTNEILVLLGDNWFAERSAKQAIEIIERRLELVKKTIDDLEVQLQDQLTKIGLASEVLEGAVNSTKLNEEGLPFVEIVEEYHDEKTEQTKAEKETGDSDDDENYVEQDIFESSEDDSSQVGRTDPVSALVDDKSQIRRKDPVSAVVVERDTNTNVDIDELENEIWTREITSEYNQRRQSMIAQYGGFNTPVEEKEVPQADDKPRKKISRFRAARLQGNLD